MTNWPNSSPSFLTSFGFFLRLDLGGTETLGMFASLVHGGKEDSRVRGRLVVSPRGGIAHENQRQGEVDCGSSYALHPKTASVLGREPIKKAAPFRGHPFQRGKVGRKSEATGVAPCGGRPTAMRDVENVEESDVAQSGCDLFGCNVNVHLRNQNGKRGCQAAPLP